MKNQKIIKICNQKLIFLNYAESTRNGYLNYISKFLEDVGDKQTIHLSSKDFQDYLDNQKFTSISQQNQVINAIRFLYKEVLKKRYNKVSFKRPREEKKLPQPIDSSFLISRISTIKNLKHKSIVSLAFSVGLRVSEVINLKIPNIDSKRMMIKITQGKGKKDRYVPLSNNLLSTLRDYYKSYKPQEYLFNGQSNKQYSATSCNKLVKKYIGIQYHFHQLRHSCFTHLHESGISIRDIQELAGHSSSNTTEVYTKVSRKQLSKLPLPI